MKTTETLHGRPRLEPRAFKIAERIRERRLQLGLTKAEMERHLELKRNGYHIYEKQFSPSAEQRFLRKLSQILQAPEIWFTDGQGMPPETLFDLTSASPSNVEDLIGDKENHDRLPKKYSLIEREKLAERAKRRRELLRISANELAVAVGVKYATVKCWETHLTQTPKTEHEAVWERVLAVPKGWLRNANMTTPDPIKAASVVEIHDAPSAVAGEIRAIACWLARPRLIRRTSKETELTQNERRHADIFAIRYGVDGEDASILQAVGDRYGVTRERIRQITAKMLERAADLRVETPCLDRLQSEIRLFLPSTVDALDKRFRDLLGERLTIVGAANFATEVLGKRVVTITDSPMDMAKSGPLVAIDPDNHEPEIIRAIRDVAMGMIRSVGAANALCVAGAAGEATGQGVLPIQVTNVCKILTGFQWLVEQDGWFWFGPDIPGDNYLHYATRKVLAAANGRVDVEELQQACSRSRRAWIAQDRSRPIAVELPIPVITAILTHTPWLKAVQSNDFMLIEQAPVGEILSETELRIFRELKAAGGLSARLPIFQKLVQDEGMHLITFQSALANSPVFKKLDTGVFAIRGWPWARDMVEAPPTGNSKVAASVEDPTQIFIDLHLSEAAVKNYLCDVPVASKKHLSTGPYTVEGYEETAELVILDKGQVRFNRLMRKIVGLGHGAGDSVRLVVDRDARHIRINTLATTGEEED